MILDRLMSLHPKIIDLTLDRVHRLLDSVGRPELKLPPVIHIAGTNGKGSTLAMIRAGLEASGRKVHAYTSPHLARFHERIYLAGSPIDEEVLSSVLDECESANQGIPITYFEITTVAALLAFSRVPADYLLLEVGLGGRLDATNVIDKPAMTVITPISLDHQGFLGETLPEIAFEKAGILKPSVPCVVGRQEDEALEVIEFQAARKAAPLSVHGQHWHVADEDGRLVFSHETGLIDLPRPNLIGAHQLENAGAALEVLRQLSFGEWAFEGAVTNADWPARMQLLRKGPLVELAGAAELWLDGGHNPAAGSALAQVLAKLPEKPTYLICGMLKTKDVSGYMAPLVSHVSGLYSVSIPGEQATLTADETGEFAKNAGIPSQSAPDVKTAIREITKETEDVRILICGSLYLAGAVLRENA